MSDSIGSTDSIASAVARTVQQVRELYIASGIADWDSAVNGTQENLEKAAAARSAWLHFWADPAAFEQFRDWDQSHATGADSLLARQIHLLHYRYAQEQRDSDTIDEITQLMMKIDDAYTNFRGKVGGEPLTNNAIEQILEDEVDNEVRREAWEASKQIGPLVADNIRQLARLRNQTAYKMGYANFHRMNLELDEIDPDWLYAMLDNLAVATDGPFREVKGELDAHLSQRYRVPVEDLRPWHYSDMFFQRAPKVGSVDLDVFFDGQNLEALALKTYDGLGMDTRDVIARSDLYERPMKNQHAFCIHVDREGDVRTLCNLQSNRRWMDTILHELGHAVYDKYIPHEIPWFLREPAHILSTEAMAILMGGMTFERDWLTQIRDLDAAEVDGIIKQVAQYRRLERLIFARWVMVMVNFERGMYEDPERDLDTLWWDLIEKYQFVKRPEARTMPDWATKYHVALAPAYYQNYLIGEMMSVQWQRWLDAHAGGLINRAAAGDFFRDRVFAVGRTMTWNDALEQATGEKLNIQYYVDKCNAV
ncbi:MAG: M2 family metallopeptidase [Chloroflexota bacterium]